MPKRFNFDMRKLSYQDFTNQIKREDALEILKESPLSAVSQK